MSNWRCFFYDNICYTPWTELLDFIQLGFITIFFRWIVTQIFLFFFYLQRQHHHQYNQLCHQRVCWFCHFLHPGLHGTPPECPCVGGGWSRPGTCVCSLPRSPHSAAHFSTLVIALLLHAHPSRTWDSGEAWKLYTRCICANTVYRLYRLPKFHLAFSLNAIL